MRSWLRFETWWRTKNRFNRKCRWASLFTQESSETVGLGSDLDLFVVSETLFQSMTSDFRRWLYGLTKGIHIAGQHKRGNVLARQHGPWTKIDQAWVHGCKHDTHSRQLRQPGDSSVMLVVG